MFTGLVETTGTLVSMRERGVLRLMDISAPALAGEILRGQSLSVSGACLTVSGFSGDVFSVDVMPETIKKTRFRNIRPGDRLNLERALRMGDRLDGHLVTGHVDFSAPVVSVSSGEEGFLVSFLLPREHGSLLVPQGSVAIDGVSLTVASLSSDAFSVSLIPETLGNTTLSGLRPGDEVNVETDILGKYVLRILSGQNIRPGRTGEAPLSMATLRDAGWL